MNEEYETEFTDEIICPWCGYKFSDSWEYDDEDGSIIDCPDCNKPIILGVHISVSYITRRGCDGIVILHNYKDYSMEESEYTREVCSNCRDTIRKKKEVNK